MHVTGEPRATRARVPLAVLIAACLLAGAGRAHADRVDDLIDQLGSDSDVKLRLSAALNLGKMNDKRAIVPFIEALTDPDKTVRGVAAAAIGKLVDRSVDGDTIERAISALDRVARADRDGFVRSQAQKSLGTLRGFSGGSTPTAPVGRGGVYIEVGPMADATKKGGTAVATMRQTALQTLSRKAPNFQTSWFSGKSPTELELKKSGASGFYLDGTLVKLDVTKGGVPQVSCSLSLILATYPQKSIFGFMKGGAAVEAASSSERSIAQATDECVGAVIEDVVVRQVVPTIQTRVR